MPTLPIPTPRTVEPIVHVTSATDYRGAAPRDSWHSYAPHTFRVSVFEFDGTPESMLRPVTADAVVLGTWLDEALGRGTRVVFGGLLRGVYEQDRDYRAEGIAPAGEDA